MICLFALVLFVIKVDSAEQNVSCPFVPPRHLDWKELDGKWYVAAVATHLPMLGDCAMVVFNHKSDNTTDISISWVANNTVSYHNGTVSLVDTSNGLGDMLLLTYKDEKAELYSFLDVDYDHYAVIFTCYNNSDGSSSRYEIWKLTRTPHLKETDRVKMDQAVGNYSLLQSSKFLKFNNTEDTCRINGGTNLTPVTLIMTSAAALSLFRRFF